MISANLSGVQQKKYMEYDDGYNSRIIYLLTLKEFVQSKNPSQLSVNLFLPFLSKHKLHAKKSLEKEDMLNS